MSTKETLMWLLSQKSPIHRKELRERLKLSRSTCQKILRELKRDGRIVFWNVDWVAASLYEAMFGPSFLPSNRRRRVGLED